MQRFEYKVVPAPRRGEKARGVKTVEDRFALALTHLMNEQAAEGWEYQRADALPVDERAGFTGGTRTSFQNMLVFRRALPERAEGRMTAPVMTAPVVAPPVVAAAATAAPKPEPKPEPAPQRLGAADAPAGPAPSLGPAKADLAAD